MGQNTSAKFKLLPLSNYNNPTFFKVIYFRHPNNKEIIVKLKVTTGAETPFFWSTNKVTVIVNLLPQMDFITKLGHATCKLT